MVIHMDLVKLKKPKTDNAIINILRDHLKNAFNKRLVYLEIIYRYEGDDSVSSISINSME